MPPCGIRRKEGLDVWQLPPGKRYFRHDRDSWPQFTGQAFEILNECLEDQLAAEAMAFSPLNYEHDDKENAPNSLDTRPSSDFHEAISVVSGSQHRLSSEDDQAMQHLALVNYALYDIPRDFPQSYGLGSSDGAQDEPADQTSTPHSCVDLRQGLPAGSILHRRAFSLG